MSKIVVGMSGGVDSAVVAQLLKNQGHEVIGVFMRNWDSNTNNDFLGNPHVNATVCPEERDWQDVVALGKQIGIEVRRVDFVSEYWDMVFQDLIDQYKKGRTPNPDILCNKYIKFGSFFNWVSENISDFDYIATGHYADLKDGLLKTPLDSWKDQTYFLAQVSKEQFANVIFPLSNLSKDKVREIAKNHKLEVADKKDSTGICFIGERDFTKFLQNYIPAQPGDIVDITTNKVVDRHVGAMYYTIGQRKGLNMGGQKEPFYVVGHDLNKKIVYVAPQSDKKYLFSDEAKIVDINWFNDNKINLNDLEVKFRYKSQSVKCNIEWIDGSSLKVFYKDGFEAVTPGQQAVFYKDGFCLGGGVIDAIYENSRLKEYL